MSKVLVRCTLDVEIDWPDEPTPEGFESREDWIKFRIEENGCPGTGEVGRIIDLAIEDAEDRGVCWGCNLGGTNKVISIK